MPNREEPRSKEEMETIREEIETALAADAPMTVRQVFYRLVAREAIAKTEGEYKSTVVRLLKEMRESGRIPWDQIVDHTRWRHIPLLFNSREEGLRYLIEHYRRDPWENQEVYLEVWIEKAALIGVFEQETVEWGVSLMPAGGDASLTFLHEAGEEIGNQAKPVYIYYFGDRDPSGVDIPRVVEEKIRKYAAEFDPNVDITFERVAVTPEQIVNLGLPTRPTKAGSRRSPDFRGESVELDAIPPAELRRLVRECIEPHVNQDRLRELMKAQARDKRWLQELAEKPRRVRPKRKK